MYHRKKDETYGPFIPNDTAYHDVNEFDWSLGYAAAAPEMQADSGCASSLASAPPAIPPDVQNPEHIADDNAEDGRDAAPNPAETSRLRAKAVSTKHLLTHLPKNPYCESCRLAKAKRTHRRDKKNRADPSVPPEHFGEQCTADHVFSANNVSQGIGGQKYAI